jgi:hypothetical protein
MSKRSTTRLLLVMVELLVQLRKGYSKVLFIKSMEVHRMFVSKESMCLAYGLTY